MSSSDGPKLPEDVVVEILKRLPVKFLLRCRCVSRSWRSSIDAPHFAALHLKHSALDASNWYLLCVDLWHAQGLCSLFSNEFSKSQIEIPYATPVGGYSVDGSCNGLICLSENSRSVYRERKTASNTMYLWNLFTRKHKAVPRSGLEHQSIRFSAGFGFDAGSNDYKIVRIGFRPRKRTKNKKRTPQVEIYSLSTDSWRTLECEFPTVRRRDRAVFLNGNLHWYAFKYDDLLNEVGYGSSIVLFDVASEVFGEMAPPEVLSRGDALYSITSVAVLNDLLAVVTSVRGTVVDPEPHFGNSVRVWVMREYGVPESWTKLYSFEACDIVTRIDGFTRSGELVMQIIADRVSWNPITGHYTNLPVSVTSNLVNVVGSLVSPCNKQFGQCGREPRVALEITWFLSHLLVAQIGSAYR